MTADESVLIRQVCAGDELAYRQLVDRHLPSISNYVMRMMANHADAEDIIQETLTRLWTHAKQYRSETSRLTTWLHNIAHHRCVDYFRQNNRWAGEDGIDSILTDGPFEAHHRRERQQRVATAMMTLPERQRSAVILCHYQGLSNREVAEVLGISVRALESILVRTRAKLKEVLIDES